MSKFENEVKKMAEKAVLSMISQGHWIIPDYNSRVKISAEMMAEVWSLVDQDRLKKQMAERLETEFADRVINMMASEIATDVKQILSVKERREALRQVARNHMEEIMRAGL